VQAIDVVMVPVRSDRMGKEKKQAARKGGQCSCLTYRVGRGGSKELRRLRWSGCRIPTGGGGGLGKGGKKKAPSFVPITAHRPGGGGKKMSLSRRSILQLRGRKKKRSTAREEKKGKTGTRPYLLLFRLPSVTAWGGDEKEKKDRARTRRRRLRLFSEGKRKVNRSLRKREKKKPLRKLLPAGPIPAGEEGAE